MSRWPTAYSARTSEPMRYWSAWPDRNAGYKSGWRASPISPRPSSICSAHDKIVTRLIWRGTHAGSSGGVKATGKPVQVRDFAVWCFEDGQVAEISTIQDQFALLKQMRYFPEESMRRSRARWPRAADGGRWSASCGQWCRPRADLVRLVVMSTRRVGWRQPWTVSRYQ